MNGNGKTWIVNNKIKSTIIGVSVAVLVTFSWNYVLPSVFNQAVTNAMQEEQAKLKDEITRDINDYKKKVDEDREKLKEHTDEIHSMSKLIADLTSQVKSLKEAINRNSDENANLAEQVHQLLIVLLEKKE